MRCIGLKSLSVSLLLIAGFAAAETCPASPNHVAALNGLLSDLQAAKNEMAARLISNDMWAFWTDAPDDDAQVLLDRGMHRRAAWDLEAAIADFDALIQYCPHYAEGYNQRAFSRFLARDFTAALADLDRAIVLSPAHIGAISGRAMTLIALGLVDQAQEDLRRAVALNPWLPERALLPPDTGAKDL